MIELIRAAEQPDSTLGQRQSQAEKIVNLRKREARMSAAKAMLDMQTAFEKLAIAHADIDRLGEQAKLIEAAHEVESRDSYLKSNENWAELQRVRSERIEAAVEFEIAKIKLLRAQGLVAQSCGEVVACIDCQ